MSNQNTLVNKAHGRSEDIDKEVQSLLKKNTNKPKTNYAIVEELKQKFKDDEIVDTIMKKYSEKLNRVRKLSEKIRDKLISKYPNLSMKEYIDKIVEYQKKYNFDENEMNAIIQQIFYNKNFISNNDVLDISYNEMSKALGFIPQSYNFSGKMMVKKEELEQLQGILTIASATKELHSQVTLQSLIYEDLSTSAITSSFDRNRVNVFSFVHPVVAALFLPKIQLLEEHMLLASISNIVSCRYNNVDIQTQPEYELYMDIATDPSEVACVTKSKPFTDLLNRCNVQTKLWEAVLNLRQGKYYTNDLSSFILAIDSCKNTVFDAADLAYVKDEGTVLRKLLSAFSIRPTIVSTAPIYGISSITSNIAALSTTHITTISMITMRIPIYEKNNGNQTVKLSDSLDQKQLYIHRKQITAKTQQIMYSREVLIFYVHRRFQLIDLGRLSRPYSMATLPVTMSQYEKLQSTPVYFEPIISIANQTFALKSVVAVEVAPNKPDIIVGCCALIKKEIDGSNWAYYYTPLDLTGQSSSVIEPLKVIPFENPVNNTEIPTMYNISMSRGTLFIYQVSGTHIAQDSLFNFNP
jgi:hypothetical protein